jgi:KaiC/GvpD/RAD55 family RecA-like ATPase
MQTHHESAIVIPTNISFVDRLLNGGHYRGKIHGLLGTVGVGKTTLGAMIAAEGALREHYQGNSGAWYFITLDQRASEIRWHMLSHGAKIKRESCWGHSPRSTFSTPDSLRPY